MAYTMYEQWTSSAQSSRASYGWYAPPDGITWHWWGLPEWNATFDSTIDFFINEVPKRPVAQRTSAHYVVSDAQVACIVSPDQAAWHAGSTEGNGRTIGIEVDPKMPGQTLETCAELAAYLEGLYGSLNHYGHQDWTATQCPGDLYPKIPWLIQRTNELTGSASAVTSGSVEAMIAWFQERRGKVTYSMTNRSGPSSYDCSSAVYSAAHEAGVLPASTGLGNTETLFNDLERNGWSQVPATASGIPARRGDIFIWGVRGASTGAAGHTGVFLDEDSIIHCNYGYNSITINDHDVIWTANGQPPCTIYRQAAGASGGAAAAMTTTKEWDEMASKDEIKAAVREVVFEEKRTEFSGRTLGTIIREVDRATWNTKKMLRYLFNQYRIGIPGVMTDGRLGGKIRKVLGYNEAEDGRARAAEWAADANRAYDF